MAAEPYNERAVHHLDWAIFSGSFDVFVDFTGSSGANPPSGWALVIAGNDKSPSWHESVPRPYFDRDSILHAFERVVNSPVVLGIAGFAGLGRWTGPMGIGRMVMGVFWTLSQRVLPG